LEVETVKTGLSAKQWLFCQPGKKGFPDRISRRERAWSAVQSANQNLMTDPHQAEHPRENKGCVSHTVALPFTLKSMLRQKKNYENSIIYPCKNIICKKILYEKPKSFKIS
jgi:hypothetical protein